MIFQDDRTIPDRVGRSDDQMLSGSTSTSSTANLPRIKKKPKPVPVEPVAGPSGLQDVPVNLGFRDPSDRRSKDRKDRNRKRKVAKNRVSGRDPSNEASGRDVKDQKEASDGGVRLKKIENQDRKSEKAVKRLTITNDLKYE